LPPNHHDRHDTATPHLPATDARVVRMAASLSSLPPELLHHIVSLIYLDS
jgi:hypothetical protein